jgi:hypothetical protein
MGANLEMSVKMSSVTGNCFFKYTGFSFSINFFQKEDGSIFKIVL